ncbi:MAG: hypothetical protein IJ193_08070 [Bacilli bacterium]|nr:hypothetical protein [Bacilli bacterium]
MVIIIMKMPPAIYLTVNIIGIKYFAIIGSILNGNTAGINCINGGIGSDPYWYRATGGSS